MDYQDRIAVVTGGASGIGRALGIALADHGARVVLADVDLDGARRTCQAPQGRHSAPQLRRHAMEAFDVDVSDAGAVAKLVSSVLASHGRIDFMFNNAGVVVAGEVRDLSVEHWKRIIDVNLMGVVNGVAACYPVMIKQGAGHIVNTASLGGLVSLGLLAPYVATKHAVVGLSESLRMEAAQHGVKVTVVCPGAIDTPMLDSKGPVDLPRPASAPDLRRYLTEMVGKAYSADALATDILKGLARNKARIVAPRMARLAWRAQRLAPSLVEARGRRSVGKEMSG